jgi:hypothetical protein
MWRDTKLSAYNTLIVQSQCRSCHQETQIKIQFKFGDTWDYKYFIKDEIGWGGNDFGKKGLKKVVLDGVSEPCEKCKAIVEYLIYVEKDVIQSVEENKGQYNFNDSEGYFLVLDP